MNRPTLALAVLATLAACFPAPAQEAPPTPPRPTATLLPRPDVDPDPQQVANVARNAADSLVIVKYVWDGEAARRELEGMGVVMNDQGLVVCLLDLMPAVLPDAQLKEFQILVPNKDADATEVKATLLSRDERTGLVFLQPAKDEDAEATTRPTIEWKPAAFGAEAPGVGDYVLSVGRLPEGAGYQPYVNVARVSTILRGPMPLVGVSQSLTGAGSVVTDAESRVIGFIESTDRQTLPFLTGANPMGLIGGGPNVFVPIEYYELSLKDPPSEAGDPKLPYLGAERLTGLTKELRGYYELGATPAVQVGDIIEDSPAQKAGMKAGDVIVAMGGQPLERGDAPDELPAILNRTLGRMPVGSEVTFTLLDAAKQKRDVTTTLEERPKQVREAERWFAEDLGYSVRELVFADRYLRKLPKDAPGVAVAFVRPQSNAQAAGMQPNDLIRKINQDEVTDLTQFKEKYEAFRMDKSTEPVVLEVLRGSETNILRIEVPR